MTIQRATPEDYFKNRQKEGSLVPVAVNNTSYSPNSYPEIPVYYPSELTSNGIDTNIIIAGMIIIGIVAIVAIVYARK